MSAADLGAVAGEIHGWLAGHLPVVDLGSVMVVLGTLILGTMALYYAAKIAVRILSWIAGLTPEGFAKLMFVVGVALIIAGVAAP